MLLPFGVLIAALLGSVHCAAMCGAFTCLYTPASPVTSQRGALAGHAAYNLGRLTSYLTLGVLAGILGGAVNQTGTAMGVGAIAGVVAGVLLVLWGTHMGVVATGRRLPTVAVPAPWQRAMGSVLLRVRAQPPVVRAGITGLVTTLLPCGWLYAFTVVAAGAGSPSRSALVMLFFWLGTLPMMMAVAMSGQRLFGSLRQRLPMLSASLLVLLGLFSIAGHLGLVTPPHWLHQLMPLASGETAMLRGVVTP